MTLKDGIMLAAEILNIGGDELTKDSETMNTLVSCANICLDEVVCEYLPIIHNRELECSTGLIKYEQLDSNVIEIVWVKKDGKKADYELTGDGVIVPKGKYTIRFKVRPPHLSSDDDVPVFALTPRVLSYGIITEYMLKNGFYEEAATYDRRFKDALAKVAYGTSERRVKRRRWLK